MTASMAGPLTAPPAAPIRVLLVDDEPLVREGFGLIVGSQSDLEVVGDAADGAAGVELARRHRPDVVLMDVRMPVLDGIAATRAITAELATTRVIVLTTFDLDDYVHDALRAGASGFLLKRVTGAELLNAIRVVASGEALLAPSVTRRLIERFYAGGQPGTIPHGTAPGVVDLAERYRLTDREIDVLHELAAGRSNAEIAAALQLGESTVKTHISNVFVKTGCRDRVQAVILAYDCGLVAPRTP